MPDSLDELLSSCSLASRAIRLLTAETKRQSILLRAACSEYELALDRLSLARVDACHQHDSEHQITGTAAATRKTLSAANPDPHVEARQSLSKARRRADVVGGFGAASATTARRTSFREPTAEVVAAPQSSTIEHATSHYSQPSIDSYASGESSHITKSLEDILEQARSIRTSNSKKGAGGSVPSQKWPATARESEQAAVTTVSGGGGGGGGGGRATAVGSRSGRGGRSRAGRSHSGSGDTRSSPWHPCRLKGSGTAGKASPSLVPAQSHEIDNSSSSSHPRGRKSGMRRSEARRLRSSDSQPTVATSGPSEYQPGQQDTTVAVPAAAVTGSTEVTANLASGMWEQVARYETARRRYIGRDGISSRNHNSGSSGGGGDMAGKSWRGGFGAVEKALLHGLESDSFFARHYGDFADWRDTARPDTQFLDFFEFQWSLPSSERELHNQHQHQHQHQHQRQHRLGAGSGVDPRYREGGTKGPEECSGRIKLERLQIERLQRSLLMMLDELEGRREVLAHEEFQRKEKTAGKRGSDGRSTEGDGRGGTRLPLQEFEDWYWWNKVAHVTGMLRESLSEAAHDSSSDGVFRSSLSKEAAYLVEHPSLVLAGENPLLFLSQPHDDSHWRSAWQRSSEAQELCGTACLSLVQELQATASSCWPHNSDCPRGHTAGLFAQQLRNASILAAETDVARLVMPALARELAHARLPKSPFDQGHSHAPHHQLDHLRQQDQQTQKNTRIAQARVVVAGKHGHNDGVDCFRERVSKRLGGHNEKREEEEETEDDKDDQEEELQLWAPALAVFRAVDAVLSDGGRPGMSFVRSGPACAIRRM